MPLDSYYEPFASLGLALAAGLLIGLEREQSAPDTDKTAERFLGGARTYPLVALLGAVSMLVARELGGWIVGFSFAAVLAFLLVAYVNDVWLDRGRGLTSEMAFLVSFTLGVLALSELFPSLRVKALLIASLAVVATLLLSIKPELHAFARSLSKADVYASIKLMVIATIVLPLLPDEDLGPLQALNPRLVGLMAVLIAGISFVGYVAIRLLGARRGLVLTGLVGGFVSSTAVTLGFSGRAKETPALSASCALAVVAASSIMFGRVLIEVGLVNPRLVAPLAVPMIVMLVTGLAASWLFWRRANRQSRANADVELQNPFELGQAIRFAAFFAVVLLVSKAASVYLGARGIYLAGFLAGLADVHAITLSMAGLSKSGVVEPNVAVTTILLGAASNTMVKAGLAVVVGGWAFGRRVLAALGVVLLAGALALGAVLLVG